MANQEPSVKQLRRGLILSLVGVILMVALNLALGGRHFWPVIMIYATIPIVLSGRLQQVKKSDGDN